MNEKMDAALTDRMGLAESYRSFIQIVGAAKVQTADLEVVRRALAMVRGRLAMIAQRQEQVHLEGRAWQMERLRELEKDFASRLDRAA